MLKVIQIQIWISGEHNKKLLQSTEQLVVPEQFDLLSNTSKTCEWKWYSCTSCLMLPSTYSCTNCFKLENQTLTQLSKLIKRKNRPYLCRSVSLKVLA